MTNITVPSYTLPQLVRLEGNNDNLYYYQVETKKDLVDITHHLTTVVGLNPSVFLNPYVLSGSQAVFKANDQLYLLTASIDGNPNGEYFIELIMHKCICGNTSELVTWFIQYDMEANKHLHFNDIWEELHSDPFELECPRSSIAGNFIPEGTHAGLNAYIAMLSQDEVFANLFTQLKD